MAAQTSMLHIRIDNQLKAEATETLANFGLTIPDAVRMFLTRVIKEGGLPVGITTDPEAHDVWFREKVQEAMRRIAKGMAHEQVMDEAQALIDRKRRAGS